MTLFDLRDYVQTLNIRIARRSGKALMAYSPFRDDGSKPSFAVYADGYKDFGGGADSGSAADFIMRYHNVSFVEAKRIMGGDVTTSLSDLTPVPDTERSDAPPAEWQRTMRTFIEDAHQRLLKTPAVLAYLTDERGLSLDTIQAFRLGWVPRWTRTGYFDEDENSARRNVSCAPGVVIPWDGGGTLWAVRVRTVTGGLAQYLNVAPPCWQDGREYDKYLSVRGSRQSSGLFNANALTPGVPALIVEGEFDAMLAAQHTGLPAVTRGSAGDHRNIRRRWLAALELCDTVYSLMDTDRAGDSATAGLSEALGDLHRPLRLPVGKDFTEYVVDHRRDGARVLDEALPRLVIAPDTRSDDTPPPIDYREPPPETDDPEHQMVDSVTQAVWANHAAHRDQQREKRAARRRRRKLPLAQRVQPVGLDAFTAWQTVNLRYVSDIHVEALAQIGATIVKSPIGTGKTELIPRLEAYLRQQLGRQPKILVLSHRQALANNLASRLGFTCYKHISQGTVHVSVRVGDGNPYQRAQRLVMSYDSVHKLQEGGTPLPRYDLIVIDEIEQFHQHVGGATMDGNAAQNYAIVKALVGMAGVFVGLDAHASNKSLNWLRDIREGAIGIENTYQIKRGTLTLYRERTAAIARAFAIADRDEGTVVIPTNSPATARQLGMIAAQRYGAEAVRVIYQRNAHYRKEQTFLENINDELPALRMLIYSPSLGTGIDIQAPVRAVCGVFSWKPLSPADMHQMMGRCRQAQERFAYVQDVNADMETEWEAIYTTRRNAALKTAHFCEFDAHGIQALPGEHENILKLLSRFAADRNRHMSDPLSYFVALAEHDGFAVAYSDAPRLKPWSELLRVARDQISMYDRDYTHAVRAVDDTEFEHHLNNGTLDEDIQYGYDRWQIEHATGLELDENGQTVLLDDDTPVEINVYDDMHRTKDRRALRTFADLLDAMDDLKDADRAEAKTGRVASRRGHRARRTNFIHTTLMLMFGDSSVLAAAGTEFTEDQVNARLLGFFAENLDALHELFGYRLGHHSPRPVMILQRILNAAGIEMERDQRMAHGKRFMIYWISRASADKMRVYGEARLRHLQRLREQRDAIPTNREDIYSAGAQDDAGGGRSEGDQVVELLL